MVTGQVHGPRTRMVAGPLLSSLVNHLRILVGVRGFEPPASTSRT